ncbi:MAG: DUF1801 domain-containing protein [Actinomycetota bacterium]|nr:DUF1801 domain-containing protein [Actinomycetota bacterium]
MRTSGGVSPTIRYHRRPLVSIGAAQRHVALYVMYRNVLRAQADELKAYDTSNTVARFHPNQPILVLLLPNW